MKATGCELANRWQKVPSARRTVRDSALVAGYQESTRNQTGFVTWPARTSTAWLVCKNLRGREAGVADFDRSAGHIPRFQKAPATQRNGMIHGRGFSRVR